MISAFKMRICELRSPLVGAAIAFSLLLGNFQRVAMASRNIEGTRVFVNDTWVRDGIDNGQTFHTASPRTVENLWDAGAGRERVFAREIRQLECDGYCKVGGNYIPLER